MRFEGIVEVSLFTPFSPVQINAYVRPGEWNNCNFDRRERGKQRSETLIPNSSPPAFVIV